MYNINYIKKSKAFFSHYAYYRNNLNFQEMVPYIKKSNNYFIIPNTKQISFIIN